MEENRQNWHHLCKQMQMFALNKTHPFQILYIVKVPFLLFQEHLMEEASLGVIHYILPSKNVSFPCFFLIIPLGSFSGSTKIGNMFVSTMQYW